MRQKTILVISADSLRAKIFHDCLKEAGFEVQLFDWNTVPVVSHRDEQAIQFVENDKASLVLLDWTLPDSSGIDLLRRLRARPPSARLPVILIGESMQEKDRLHGLEAGADLCISDTQPIAVFVARVRALLRRSYAK
jgi:two-component system phosphate regulon response regulator PhoB